MLCKAIKLSLIILLTPFIIKGFSFVSAQEKIDINTATLEQLEVLTGVGPVYAQRIIDARPFSSVDDLLKVSGIGEKTLQKIKDQGLAYVESQPIEEEAEETPEVIEDEPVQTPEAVIPETTYPEGIIISKIMPSPEGADAENEYIELKNTNNFEVDLSKWILRDTQGSTKEYTLKEKIPALGILTLLRTKTKITLNNSGDGVELLNPLNKIVDSVDFGKAETGIAFIKTSSGWQWDIAKPIKVAERTEKPIPASEEDQPKEEVEINLSSSSETSVYLTGFLVALVCSVIFFILKKKLYKDQYSEI